MNDLITVIGNPNCNRCGIIQNMLKQKGIEFEYKYLKDYSEGEQEKILQDARDNGFANFPIIYKDGVIIDVKGII